MTENYLKPKVGSPKMLRDKRNGQFSNPPLYMVWGGLKAAGNLLRGTSSNLSMEKGGPSAKRGKPI
jgi:hypothetical protein